MPLVTVASRPNGEPIATTPWPTWRLEEWPMVAGVSPVTPSAWTTAVSVSGSVPSDLRRGVRAVVEVDADLAALAGDGEATWLLVRILPSALRMMPEPEPEPLEPLTLILTTEGSTLWATFTIESVFAAGTAELPLWVMIGDEAVALSCVEVHTAAPPMPAAPPTSRLAATTPAARPLPRVRFCWGASAGAAASSGPRRVRRNRTDACRPWSRSWPGSRTATRWRAVRGARGSGRGWFAGPARRAGTRCSCPLPSWVSL